MTFAQMVRDFFSVMRKAFVFKHYLVLGEKDVGRAFRYFLTLLAFSFVLVLLLLVPKAIDIASNAQTNALSIGQLRLDARLTTKGPVMLPSKSPFLTLDTTGNKILLLTSPKIKFDAKEDMLKKVLVDISPLAMNLMRLLKHLEELSHLLAFEMGAFEFPNNPPTANAGGYRCSLWDGICFGTGCGISFWPTGRSRSA